ncbi:hypothetical protein [Methanothrix soehngenii]|uniref:hypothetical protein n=1 Tax=Methanothrix soehngenii TaxID=2223 RepID=UPI00300CEDB6
MLAKVDRIDILSKAFPDANFCITNSVYAELMRAKHADYSFPDRIFEQLPVITMDRDDLKAFKEISTDSTVHYGEAEGLSICREKKATFLTDDRKVIRFAEKNGIASSGYEGSLNTAGHKTSSGIQRDDFVNQRD